MSLILNMPYFCTFLGGVKSFAGNENSVLRWCLNRPLQAKNLEDLLILAGL